jgi:16S rRNA (guanine966-N2)-methyltransferase
MPDRPKNNSRSPRSVSLPNKLRIIGGQWRGRKLAFPAIEAIRPTPDRVRETVFNWLQTDVAGARCLDLFAGSGALGFEALSRGAKQVVFVDREPRVGQYLRETLKQLNTTAAEVHTADSLRWLTTTAEPFDIVFLDPPFAADLIQSVCRHLDEDGWLTSEALIYIESPSSGALPALPATWSLIKSKTAGQVGYHLARRRGGTNSNRESKRE